MSADDKSKTDDKPTSDDKPKPGTRQGEPRERPAWLQPFLMILATITVMVLAYFVFYVTSQRTYFGERSVRLLADLAQRIEQKTRVTILRAAIDPKVLGKDSSGSEKSTATVGISNGQPYIEGPSQSTSTDATQTLSFGIEDVADWATLKERFDDVWIVDQGGNVLAQLNPSGRPHEGSIQLKARSETPSTDKKLFDSLTEALGNFWNFAWPQDAERRSFWGKPYLAFSYPLVLPSEASGGGFAITVKSQGLDKAVLYGIVSQDSFRKDAVTLSYTSLTLISGVVLLAFLAVPYVKVRFMARRERLRAFDLWLLGASGLIATHVAVIAVVATAWHALVSARMDDALASFSNEIATHARNELQTAASELDDDIKNLQEVKLQEASRQMLGDALVREDGWRIGTKYPYLENVFLTDSDGKQIAKIMTARKPTERVTLNDEHYFKDATKHPPAVGEPPILRMTQAPNSGKYLAVLARPPPTDGPPSGEVAVLATKVLSLMQPTMPYPLEYAVLDQHGDAVFRSGPEGRAKTHFLDEIDGWSRVSATAPGARLWLSARYLGRMHRMLLSPFSLPGAEPLTLVTFYDATVLDALVFEAVTASLFWLLVADVLAVAFMLLARGSFGPWFADWMWPSERRSAVYLGAGGGLLALGVAVMLGEVYHPGPRMSAVVLALPAALLFMCSGAAPLRSPASKAYQWLFGAPMPALSPRLTGWYPRTYLFFVVALLAVIGGLPTLLIVNESFHANARALVRLTERHYATDLEERYRRITGQYVSFGRARPIDLESRIPIANDDADFVSRRLNRTWDVYAPPFAAANEQASGRHLPRGGSLDQPTIARCGAAFDSDEVQSGTWLASIAAACLPTSSALGVDLRAELFEVPQRDELQSPPEGSRWVAADDGGDFWAVPTRAFPLSLTDLPLAESIPRLFLPLLIATAIGWVVTRSVARDILGLELEGDGILDQVDALAMSLPASQTSAAPTASRWLLLRPPGSAKSRLKVLADHADLATDQYSEPAAAARLAATAVIVNLDARLSVKTWRQELVKRIHATAEDKSLFVESAIDPIHWLSGAGASDADADEVLRWSAAMLDVRKGRFKVPTDVDQELRNALAPAASNHREQKAADVVVAECRWSHELVEIGKRFKAATLAPLSRQQIVEHIQDEAEPYYRCLWSLCSEMEKLVLIHLAEEGLVNPRHFDVLRRLRRRHLVRTHGQIRLMNESFARFVREAETAKTVAEWESAVQGRGYAQVQLPLVTIATVTAGLLLFTQQQLFDSLTSLMTAGVGAAGAIGGLMTKLRNPFAAPAKSS